MFTVENGATYVIPAFAESVSEKCYDYSWESHEPFAEGDEEEADYEEHILAMTCAATVRGNHTQNSNLTNPDSFKWMPKQSFGDERLAEATFPEQDDTPEEDEAAPEEGLQ